MSDNAYLIPSGFKEGTNLFVRAMSWGNSDNGGSPASSLPSGAHQMLLLNEGDPLYFPVKTEHVSPTKANGGFESGGGGFPDVLASWSEDWDGSTNTGTSTGYLDTSEKYDGNSSLRINFNGADNENWVRIWKSYVEIGETGRMTFYAKTSGPAGGVNVRNIRYGDGHTGVNVTETSWRKYSFIWEQTSDASTGPLMIPSASGQTFWIDNLTIESLNPPSYNQKVIDYSFYNGSFESDDAGVLKYWTTGATPSSDISIDTSEFYDGSQSLRIDLDGSSNYAWARLDNLPLISGRQFTVTYYGKASGYGGGFAGVQWDSELGGGHYGPQNFTSGWQKYSFSDVGSGHRLRLGRRASSTANSKIWIDKIEVTVEAKYEYDSFYNLGTPYYDTANESRGYLATFLRPYYESGFSVSERWKYDTYTAGGSGAASASGLLAKLQEQPPNTLLVLSTNDEPSTNADIFQTELEQNWGATKIKHVATTGGSPETELGPSGNPKYRSSYVLVSSKNRGKIFEDYANSGEGPVGFYGWVKDKKYETGAWYNESTGYLSSGQTITSYPKSSLDWSSFGTNMTANMAGFFKTSSAGTYKFRLSSDDASFFYLGAQSASGWNTGNANIELNGFHAEETGYYTGELVANTYYPFRVHWGNAGGSGILKLYYKFENEDWTNELPVYHLNYHTGDYYYPENIKFTDKYYQNFDALFSLYNINGTQTGDILLVRREYDDDEKWFNASEITGGELEHFVRSMWESDFSSGTDGVNLLRVTASGNVDGIGGYNDVLKMTANDSDLFHGFGHPSTPGNTVSGETYRIQCEVYVESGNNAIVGATIYKNSSPFNHPDAFVSGTEQWLKIDHTFTADASYRPYIVGAQSNGKGHQMPTGVSGVSGDIFYAKNYSIERISPAFDGFVKVWKSQHDLNVSGFQTNTSYQPRIVTGGNLVYDSSGNPSLFFNQDHLNTNIIPPNNLSAIAIADPSGANGMVFGARDSTDQRSYLFFNGSSKWQWGFGDSFNADSVARYSGLGMVSMYYDTGSGINVYRDSSGSPFMTGSTTALPNCTTHGYYIGAWNDAGSRSLPYNGFISFLGLWSTNHENSKKSLEGDIQNIYNI